MKNILIIGCGVIGLATAYELSKKKIYNVHILEKNKIYGQENSSKNSEVIHSGVYYKKNSLKNIFCIEGKKLIYNFCKKYKIKFKKCGKLFVATSNLENRYLNTLKINSNQNGLNDTKVISENNLKKIAPLLNVRKALSSPSAGIFDVKNFMQKLFTLSKKNKVRFFFNVKKFNISKKKNNFFLKINKKEMMFDHVINCAGIEAISIAKKNFPKHCFPNNLLVPGIYFKTNQNLKINKIIYRAMLPGDTRERIDITPCLDGSYIFGPSVENKVKINNQNLALIKKKFINGINSYFPYININKLKFMKIGVRPKIMYKKKGINEDFFIKKVPGYNWVNLFGMESPGLTASLAIAKHVTNLIGDKK